MNNPLHVRRAYQAEVYLALATILQGLTLTALGNEVVIVFRTVQGQGLIWTLVTGLLSLILCFTFWYIFVRDFFFGFRVINLTAANHFFLASAIFLTGFLQFIAFQFLTDPRLWLTLVLVSIAVVFLNSGYIGRKVEVIDRKDIRQAMLYDPHPIVFIFLILAAVGCLVAWYLIPNIDTPLFRGLTLGVVGAALVVLNVNSVQIFQRHLNVNLPVK